MQACKSYVYHITTSLTIFQFSSPVIKKEKVEASTSTKGPKAVSFTSSLGINGVTYLM